MTKVLKTHSIKAWGFLNTINVGVRFTESPCDYHSPNLLAVFLFATVHSHWYYILPCIQPMFLEEIKKEDN
jgi:hypothetical protein